MPRDYCKHGIRRSNPCPDCVQERFDEIESQSVQAHGSELGDWQATFPGKTAQDVALMLARSHRRMSIYRRIWERLPGPTRDITLSAMKCWSPEEYSVVMEDDTAIP
jgi:hypothetical protein